MRGAPADVNADGQPVSHPEWASTAILYQINVRHFTAEGTLRAAATHLPRLAELGVGILWLMPIHPIGQVHRKGSLGSPYSVRDYRAVNPEFGSLADLRAFVAQAHDLGLRVILDWVAHHTSWDCSLVEDHPHWYVRSQEGQLIRSDMFDWVDVVDLDYADPAIAEDITTYMSESMAFWVREADVDGFRCDIAGLVPTSLWRRVRAALEQIKPVFLLAEWEDPQLHEAAFDATYAWGWHDLLRQVAEGGATAAQLAAWYVQDQARFAAHDLRMMFVTNHDKNAWDGTDDELFGPALPAVRVLSLLGPGIPLVFNGQEAGLDRRLAFFDKDEITWRPDPVGELIARLVTIRRQHRVLWNRPWGAAATMVSTNHPSTVVALSRADEQDEVLIVVNLADQPVGSLTLADHCLGQPPQTGGISSSTRTDLLTGETVDPRTLSLPAWGYRVLIGPAVVGALASGG